MKPKAWPNTWSKAWPKAWPNAFWGAALFVLLAPFGGLVVCQAQTAQLPPQEISLPATSPSEPCPEHQAITDDVVAKRFLSLSPIQQDEEVMALRAHEAWCLKSSRYYALLGQDLLLANRAQEAIEALERSLLLNAEQPGVELDFAQALAMSGDIQSAQALIELILARQDVPDPLRVTLQGLLEGGLSSWRQRVLARNALGPTSSDGDQSQQLAIDPKGLKPSRQSRADFALASSLKESPQNALSSVLGDTFGLAEVNALGGKPNTVVQQSLKAPEPLKPREPKDPVSGWTYSGSLQGMVGQDSNLNSASYINTINLTLPNGVVPLVLDASSLPQAGPTQVYALQGQAQRAFEEQNLTVSGTWMQRQTPNVSNLGFRNQEVSVQWRPKSQLGWSERGVITHFELGGLNYFDGVSFTAWKEWQASALERIWSGSGQQGGTSGLEALSTQTNRSIGNNGHDFTDDKHTNGNLVCHYLAGMEIDRRTYAQDSSQNGAYVGAMLGSMCSGQRDQFNVTAQDGLDRASDPGRAGGNQQRQEFKVQWLHAVGQSRLGLEWGQQRLMDAQIYSELLGGVVRNTLRQNIRLSLDYTITQNLGMMSGSLHWVSFWESLRYRSSVDLFNLRGESVQTGVKWSF